MAFFATYGKNARDGIGGTVKREAARASLRATITGQILTPQQLFEWCSSHIAGIKFFYISKDVAMDLMFLKKRLCDSAKISGIRSHHCFIPYSDRTLKIKRISGDASTDEVIISISKSNLVTEKFTLEQFLLCRYETDLWIGNVKEISFENDDVLVSFMHPKVPSKNFHWPSREDVCWVPTQHILTTIHPLNMSKTGRVYQLVSSDEKYNK